jgi:hypothetical protein
MIQTFYTDREIPEHLQKVIEAFKQNSILIDSEKDNVDLSSNEVLEIVRKDLEKISFIVESSFQHKDKIVFKIQTKYHDELQFHADAYQEETKTIIEVEAGRAVVNYQFLKDFYQASVIKECDYLVIAVRNLYKNTKDFEKVSKFIDGFYNDDLFKIPLKGVLIIGY